MNAPSGSRTKFSPTDRISHMATHSLPGSLNPNAKGYYRNRQSTRKADFARSEMDDVKVQHRFEQWPVASGIGVSPVPPFKSRLTYHYPLPTTHCPLPTAHCPLPTAHCPLTTDPPT